MANLRPLQTNKESHWNWLFFLCRNLNLFISLHVCMCQMCDYVCACVYICVWVHMFVEARGSFQEFFFIGTESLVEPGAHWLTRLATAKPQDSTCLYFFSIVLTNVHHVLTLNDTGHQIQVLSTQQPCTDWAVCPAPLFTSLLVN